MGFENYMSQTVKQHTAGTAQPGTILVNGAAAKGAVKISLDGLTNATQDGLGRPDKIGKYTYVSPGVPPRSALTRCAHLSGAAGQCGVNAA